MIFERTDLLKYRPFSSVIAQMLSVGSGSCLHCSSGSGRVDCGASIAALELGGAPARRAVASRATNPLRAAFGVGIASGIVRNEILYLQNFRMTDNIATDISQMRFIYFENDGILTRTNLLEQDSTANRRIFRLYSVQTNIESHSRKYIVPFCTVGLQHSLRRCRNRHGLCNNISPHLVFCCWMAGGLSPDSIQKSKRRNLHHSRHHLRRDFRVKRPQEHYPVGCCWRELLR